MTHPHRSRPERGAAGWRRPAFFLALALAVALLVAAAPAWAGDYTISDCPAAGSGDAGPWTVPATPAGAKATCDGGPQDFIGWAGTSMTSNSSVLLSASAVGDITIQRATLWWAVAKSTSGSLMFAEAYANGKLIYFSEAPAGGQPQTFDFTSDTNAITSLGIGAWCSFINGLKGCTLGGTQAPALQITGARLELHSDTPPAATVTGGSLAASGTVSGVATIDYNASSTVSGVRSVDLLVDGQTVATNNEVSQCTYTSWAACPLTESGQTLSYNTAALSDGPHDVSLRVTDAAGNTTTVDDHKVITQNAGTAQATPPVAVTPTPAVSPDQAPAAATTTGASNTGTSPAAGSVLALTPVLVPAPCNGTCDSAPRLVLSPSASTASARTLRFDQSALAVGGQLLTRAGSPIAGAEVQLWQTPAASGARPSVLEVATTAPNGSWRFRIPAGPSRTLTVSYRTRATDATPATTVSIRQTVIGTVALTAPKRATFGHPVLMRGALVGGFIPSGGALVAMQIHFSGHWRTIDLVRTDAAGRFAYDYVFAGVAAGTWRFRAVVPSQAAYPFTQSSSGPIAVQVK